MRTMPPPLQNSSCSILSLLACSCMPLVIAAHDPCVSIRVDEVHRIEVRLRCNATGSQIVEQLLAVSVDQLEDAPVLAPARNMGHVTGDESPRVAERLRSFRQSDSSKIDKTHPFVAPPWRRVRS